MPDTETSTNSIDRSIEICENSIRSHRNREALFTLFMLLLITVPMFVLFLYYLATKNAESASELSELVSKTSSTSSYIIYGIYVFLFGTVISFYRYHLKEVAKYEHYLLGFMRIRIAANNSEQGFDTEVRHSLTDGAFSYENSKTTLFKKEKHIESPIPGHPTSDIGTAALNKILDSIEIVTKKKPTPDK